MLIIWHISQTKTIEAMQERFLNDKISELQNEESLLTSLIFRKQQKVDILEEQERKAIEQEAQELREAEEAIQREEESKLKKQQTK